MHRLSRWAPVLLGALILVGCAQRTQGRGPVRVAASIPPLADMARQIGGERVTVALLVPPGSSPHTYEPTPRQAQFVSTADVLLLNGVNLEFWAPKVIAAAGNAELLVVHTAEGLPVLQQEGEEGGNPHLWLDPMYAIHQAESVGDALVAVDPEYEELYRANADRYVAEIQALDQEIRSETAEWGHRRFIGFHAAWLYFAQRYGLEQVATIEEFPGKEPSPEYLAQIVRLIGEHEVPVVFAELQLPPRAAQTVAGEAGVKVIALDPLGGVPGREGYVELMRYNLAEMAKGLR